MAEVRLGSYRQGHLQAVVRLYNALVETIPCNWPVTDSEFADEVMGDGRLAHAELPFDPDTLLIAWVEEPPPASCISTAWTTAG